VGTRAIRPASDPQRDGWSFTDDVNLTSIAPASLKAGTTAAPFFVTIQRSEEGADLQQIGDVQANQLNSAQDTVASMEREANLTRLAVQRERSLLAHARSVDAAVRKNLTGARTVLQESTLLAAEMGPQLSNSKDAIDSLAADLARCGAAAKRRLSEAGESLTRLRNRTAQLRWELANMTVPRNNGDRSTMATP
jgi:hypothetical protein